MTCRPGTLNIFSFKNFFVNSVFITKFTLAALTQSVSLFQIFTTFSDKEYILSHSLIALYFIIKLWPLVTSASLTVIDLLLSVYSRRV